MWIADLFRKHGGYDLHARFARLARDAGLRIRTLSSDAWFRSPLTDPDPDVRRRGRTEGDRLVEMAARIGAEVLHVIPGMVDQLGFQLRVENDPLVDNLDSLLPEKKKRKIHNKQLYRSAHTGEEIQALWNS